MKVSIIGILLFALGAMTNAQPVILEKKLGNTIIRFQQVCGAEQPGIAWVHVHENETTAVEAAHFMIDSLKKGCFVSWKHSGDRNVSFTLKGRQYKFDPNRIFTPKGLKATLTANGTFSKAGFQEASHLAHFFIKKYIEDKKLIVAMHNNTDGGGLHIKSYLPGGEYANDAAEVYVNEAADVDDFFYTTDTRIFNFLKAKGFNILLQNNSTVTDDGSLSVYCGIKGIAYLNIEAQHGHLQQQKQMMLAVYEMMDELFQ